MDDSDVVLWWIVKVRLVDGTVAGAHAPVVTQLDARELEVVVPESRGVAGLDIEVHGDSVSLVPLVGPPDVGGADEGAVPDVELPLARAASARTR